MKRKKKKAIKLINSHDNFFKVLFSEKKDFLEFIKKFLLQNY